MIDLLADEAEFLGKWAEQCPCHEMVRDHLGRLNANALDMPCLEAPPGSQTRRHRKVRPLAEVEAQKCKFRCCRAPELAGGAAQHLQVNLVQIHKSQFNAIVAGCPPPKRAELVAAWSSARSKLYGV